MRSYAEANVRRWLHQHVPDMVLRAQILNLFEGVRDLAYQRGLRGQRIENRARDGAPTDET